METKTEKDMVEALIKRLVKRLNYDFSEEKGDDWSHISFSPSYGIVDITFDKEGNITDIDAYY